jgi:CheY-like chemotaxis protein
VARRSSTRWRRRRAALLERARRGKPALVILDSLLPDGSGFDVCRAIKDDPELSGTRVMLLLDNPATHEQLRAAEGSRCDDIFCLPAPGRRALRPHRAAARLPRGGLAAGAGEVDRRAGPRQSRKVRGEVLDLAETGARLRLAERIQPPEPVPVQLSRAITGATHELEASVIWQRRRRRTDWEAGPQVRAARRRRAAPACARPACGIAATARAASRFAATSSSRWTSPRSSASWRREAHRVRPVAGAAAELGGRLPLGGADRRAARPRARLPALLARVHQPRGDDHRPPRRRSRRFAVRPYACERCGHSELRLLQVAALRDAGELRPPVLRCSACSGELLFDDIPERYFSFLVDDGTVTVMVSTSPSGPGKNWRNSRVSSSMVRVSSRQRDGLAVGQRRLGVEGRGLLLGSWWPAATTRKSHAVDPGRHVGARAPGPSRRRRDPRSRSRS